MSEYSPELDTGAEVERLFLWQEITDVLRANAFVAGIQASHDSCRNNDIKLVLAETPKNEGDTLQIWYIMTANSLFEKVTMLYNDPDGREVFNYEITPTGITQYSLEPTPLDRGDFMELRRDVSEAKWDAQHSHDCAKETLFFN